MSLHLHEIVAELGGELRGSPDVVIHRIAPIESATQGEIAFLSNPKYQSKLKTTSAAAVIVSPVLADQCPVPAIVHAEPYLYFARLALWLNPPPPATLGVHSSATVESAVPASVSIGPGARVGAGVLIGEGCVIGPNTVIGNGVSLGRDTRLYANVTIYADCQLGERCVVHAGAVIGSDGFGYARQKDATWLKIPQTGRVVIGNDVEVGAGTTIDRGALADTVIEDGVKIDNQIQIAHNVKIGEHSAIAGCVGIAGSTTIGKRCTVGGAGMIIGHLQIADDVNVSSGTFIGKSITKAGTYTSTSPFMEHGEWLHNFARLRHLDAMADKIRALETRLNELEKNND